MSDFGILIVCIAVFLSIEKICEYFSPTPLDVQRLDQLQNQIDFLSEQVDELQEWVDDFTK